MMIGIVPDQHAAALKGRADLCETIALIASDHVARGETDRLGAFLASFVKHKDDVVSAGIRTADGELAASVGGHAELWKHKADARSTDVHVQVPIRSGSKKWGVIEISYKPLVKRGMTGWLQNPWWRFIAFVSACCYLIYGFYLQKILVQLDPSRAVPQRVRAALDSLAEGLLVMDVNHRIVLANQSFANWAGRKPEKLVGILAARLKWSHDCEAGAYPWEQALRLETPQAGVMMEIAAADGTVRTLMANASPVLGHNGKYRGVLVSFDDVTLLEETKKDLLQAKHVADDANRSKSEFLARMSHEIRTPMNAILGFTDVLRRGLEETLADRQEYLDTIHTSGQHLLALINDILDLSKVESGRLELELERCSPHKILKQVTSLLQSKADEKQISLTIEYPEPLPETILTDSVRFTQAVMNLAGNAIKFTDQGGVKIVARMRRQGKPQMAIDVIDSGIGISPAAQQKIFEPFAQADTSVTRRFGGTGLGLAISKQLAGAMGGGIEIKSTEGSGSTFTLVVDTGPLQGIPLIDAGAAEESQQAQRTATEDAATLPPGRILVADDSFANRKLLEVVLRRAGVECVAVENGKLAVEQAQSSHFDVILMDMQMPVMDGYTATSKLRDAGYERPIVALTAHAMREDEQKCRAAGCSGFLTKPMKINEVLATLNSLLTDRAGEHATRRSSPPAVEARAATARRQTPVQVQAGAANTVTQPLQCSLPLDDADFLDIAIGFAGRLQEKLAAMQQAISARNDAELADLAHWLKGSGGTAGFNAFSTPARNLELAAKAKSRDAYPALFEELNNLSQRIQLPTTCSG